jgi:hypothetical protein
VFGFGQIGICRDVTWRCGTRRQNNLGGFHSWLRGIAFVTQSRTKLQALTGTEPFEGVSRTVQRTTHHPAVRMPDVRDHMSDFVRDDLTQDRSNRIALPIRDILDAA